MEASEGCSIIKVNIRNKGKIIFGDALKMNSRGILNGVGVNHDKDY